MLGSKIMIKILLRSKVEYRSASKSLGRIDHQNPLAVHLSPATSVQTKFFFIFVRVEAIPNKMFVDFEWRTKIDLFMQVRASGFFNNNRKYRLTVFISVIDYCTSGEIKKKKRQ